GSGAPRSLHSFPTRRSSDLFLTQTGQMCTDWRQEFILLSDVLGVSMLVDAINHRRPSGATENTVLGPFYVSDAPRYENGANICLDRKSTRLNSSHVKISYAV